MRKTTLLTVIALLIGATNWAQTYYPIINSASEWNSLEIHDCGGSVYPYPSIYKTTISNETEIINNIVYHKLYRSGSYCNLGYIREENKKVYFFNGIQQLEYLLYDFTKGVNDVIQHNQNLSMTTTILAVDYVQIGSTTRKRMKVQFSGAGYGDDYIVEGIGYLKNGIVGIAIPIPICGTHGAENICYKENGTVLYNNPNYSDCAPTKFYSSSSINETSIYKQLSIYPNPFENEFTINNIPADKQLTAKIYDSLGKMIFQKEISNIDSKINISVAQGLYSIILQNKEGETVLIEKLMKK